MIIPDVPPEHSFMMIWFWSHNFTTSNNYFLRIFDLFDVILNIKKNYCWSDSCHVNQILWLYIPYLWAIRNFVIICICMELISQTILHSQDISQSSRAAFLVNVLKHEIMQLDNQTYITQQTFIRCNTRCFYHTASLFKRIMCT